jgi:hypothetical protein
VPKFQVAGCPKGKGRDRTDGLAKSTYYYLDSFALFSVLLAFFLVVDSVDRSRLPIVRWCLCFFARWVGGFVYCLRNGG